MWTQKVDIASTMYVTLKSLKIYLLYIRKALKNEKLS